MSMIQPNPSNSFPRNTDLRPHRRPKARVLDYSLRWLLATRGVQSARITRKVRSELHSVLNNNILPGAPQPPSPNFPSWASWILGTIFTVVLPLLKLKGGFLQILGKKVEQVVDAVEDVAEIVEDVAEVVDDVSDAIEKVSSDLADDLPNNSPLKGVASWVEHKAKQVGDSAELTVDLMNKVEDITDEVEKRVDEIMDTDDDDNEASTPREEDKGLGISKEKVEVQTIIKEEATIKEEVSTR